MAREKTKLQKNREKDYKSSKEIEKLLNLFYDKYVKCERVTERNLQISGVDVKISTPRNTEILVDEKCATDYIGKNLQTYSFELRASSDRVTGIRYDGWLIDENNITTHYILCYIEKCKVDEFPLSSDIQEMEVILVSKADILMYLNRHDQTLETMILKCDSIDDGDLDMGDIKDGFKYSKSRHKIEASINILIPRKALREISAFHTMIQYEDDRITGCDFNRIPEE